MPDMALATSVFKGLSMAKQGLDWAIGKKVDAEVEERLVDTRNAIGAAQDLLFEMRNERDELMEEIRSLKHQVTQFENWEVRKTEYELTKGVNNSYYFIHKEEGYRVCPNCFEDQEVRMLQPFNKGIAAMYKCPKCELTIPREKPPQSRLKPEPKVVKSTDPYLD